MDPIGELLNKYSPVFFPAFFLSIGLIVLTALMARWDKHIRLEHHRQAEQHHWAAQHEKPPPLQVQSKPEPEKIPEPKPGPDLNCPYCGAAYAVLAPTCSNCGAPRFMGEK